ncbi:MAG: GrpB family protein [Hydrogenophaga sp.]|uniref:GrpB family protein n=1 Tax=Hydrogenophaga sp. TaxID=1904254 RepID=UPI003D12E384
MIEIVPYSTEWPARFAQEAARLRSALAPWLVADIEHIGSTAVPELGAKPVIDLMAPVQDLLAARPAIAAAVAAGYCHFPYKPDQMHWFCKPSPAVRTHHLHLVPWGSALWHDRLAFRDELRSNGPLAREYERLKLALAARDPEDREAYTEAKSPFIASVLQARRSRMGEA